MNRKRTWLVSAALVLIGALAIEGARASTGERQQSTACLHGPDETAAEMQRRRQAVLVSRQIHTQEQQSRVSAGSYVALSALSPLSPAAGFDVTLVTDGKTYAFVVKDTRDPCGLAFFSDHNGLIYEGKALR